MLATPNGSVRPLSSRRRPRRVAKHLWAHAAEIDAVNRLLDDGAHERAKHGVGGVGGVGVTVTVGMTVGMTVGVAVAAAVAVVRV